MLPEARIVDFSERKMYSARREHDFQIAHRHHFMNYSLFLALLVMGFTFTVTQVAVIRELLVVFLGNELSIAIIAADWLILEAAGSFLIGRRIKSAASERKYACLQMLLSLLLPATIYAIRGLREIMGLSVGEAASLPQIFLWTAVILAPLGIVDGLLFALGCALYSDLSKRRDLTVGRVYLYEGLGAGLGASSIPLFSSSCWAPSRLPCCWGR